MIKKTILWDNVCFIEIAKLILPRLAYGMSILILIDISHKQTKIIDSMVNSIREEKIKVPLHLTE